MDKEPINDLLDSKDILLYLIGRKLLNMGINISQNDVDYVKKLSEKEELDEIVKKMVMKYRNYTDDDYKKCQLSKTY